MSFSKYNNTMGKIDTNTIDFTEKIKISPLNSSLIKNLEKIFVRPALIIIIAKLMTSLFMCLLFSSLINRSDQPGCVVTYYVLQADRI
jgi:hypothetical protein